MRKIVRTLLVSVMLVLAAIGIAACTPQNDGDVTYSISVQSAGGSAISNVTVRLLKDGEVQGASFTDEEGVAEISAPGDVYTIELSNIPTGYNVEQEYVTDAQGSPVTIRLVSSIIKDEMPAGNIYTVGSVMYDFTYTEVETGETKTLSQLLADGKEMILLNFWYVGCTWCDVEFPLMQEAYEDYEDSVAIVAINPFQSGSESLAYKSQRGLTFDVCHDSALYLNFAVSGYPTNVVVDRYGVVCEIEAGGITDADIFRQIFESYTGDDYVPDDKPIDQIEMPNVEAPSVEEIAAALNGETASGFTYRHEELEYNWPWVVSEDGKSIHNSNIAGNASPKINSYSILYLDVTLEKDAVLAFDYKTDTEEDGDILYVFIDGEIAYEYSGSNDWTTCYAYLGDGYAHEFSFAYVKDASRYVGEDTVWLRNMRISSLDELEAEGGYMEIVRQAATGFDDSDPQNPVYTNYVDIYLADDNYYHVGTKADGSAADGDPYLLAEINEDTQWGPKIYSTALDVYNRVVAEDGSINQSVLESLNEVDRFWYDNYDLITDYAWLGRFSDIQLTPVTQELKDLLVRMVATCGNNNPNDNETEWLEVCRYIEQYGDYEPMVDPIRGLRDWNAIPMKLSTDGVNNANHLVLNKILVPRGIRYKFVPEESGSYIFYSVGDHTTGNETMAWLFDDSGNIIAESAGGEGRPSVATDGNFEIVYDLIAGEAYYLACAFYSPTYFGDEYDFFCMKYDEDYIISPIASPVWTTEGEDMGGDIILPLYVDGVEYFEQEDAWYVVDENGDPVAPVMVDFKNATSFSPYSLTWFIEQGLFDFTGNGFYSYEKYQAVYDEIPEEDRLDYTSVMKEYANPRGPFMNAQGYVVANQEIVEILRILMRMEDRFTPDISWLQLCYYARPTS